MDTKLTLKPGQAGTRKLLDKYGERLVRVRYRYDAERKKRIKTAEIVVKSAGGRWKPELRRWTLPYKTVVKLGLQERVTSVAAI